MPFIPEKWRGTRMPKAIPAWFWLWAHWRDGGAVGPRPKSAPTLIPAWAWVRYLIHRGYKWADLSKPTPPPTPRDFARAVLFHAGDVFMWLSAPSFYIRALSADRNQAWITGSLVQAARQTGSLVASWCDCRPDGGTDAAYAISAARTYGLIGWYGQAETAAEFDHALRRGRELGLMPLAIIGNLTALRPDQLALVANNDVRFINELYRNVMPWVRPDYRGANAGVGGSCVAMYESASEGASRYPLSRYKTEGFFNRGTDSVYTPGSQPEDVTAA